MKKRAMMLLALAAAMGMTFGTAAFAEEAKTETKTITVDGEELTVEVTDIGKQGTFTYWSAFTGDSQTWDQWRVDAFNEAYKDLGVQVEVQFVPDGAAMASCCPRSQEEPLQIWSSLTTGFLLISMRQRDVLHHWMTH